MTANMANMSQDMSALNQNIAGMTTRIHNMSVDMRQMNQSMGAMTNSMGLMGNDINKFSNPQRMMPFSYPDVGNSLNSSASDLQAQRVGICRCRRDACPMVGSGVQGPAIRASQPAT